MAKWTARPHAPIGWKPTKSQNNSATRNGNPRSLAEAGFNAYLQGDIALARRNVAAALVTAHRTGAVGAEIRFLSAIGTGIEWNGGYKEAVVYFQKAFALAQQHPETGYPFLTAAGEIETLIKERQFDKAEGLVCERQNQASLPARKERSLADDEAVRMHRNT